MIWTYVDILHQGKKEETSILNPRARRVLEIFITAYRTVLLNYIRVLERTKFVIQQMSGRSTLRFSQVSGFVTVNFCSLVNAGPYVSRTCN